MGVPAFFRWLSSRNPSIILNAQENDEDWEDPENDPTSNINPSVDNLYLDLNGIIHPCCHPENKSVPPPVTQEDIPQKILYMAIDGVAPRAKMNQQRSRRFRAVQEREEIKVKKEKLRDYWKQEGIIDPEIETYLQTEGFDSNVITPGTQFMQELAVALNAYIYERMNNHPLWKNLKVVLSDSNIPGEGEHKILEFIRLQRSQPDYNPNTSHVLYGADADLIMLGLSTHEPYFYIFREQIISDDQKNCTLCGKQGHFFTECKVNLKTQEEKEEQQASKGAGQYHSPSEIHITFQYAKLSVMREYLDTEFRDLDLSFQYNLERIIDDFNFMCFFVGNDFMPHIPTLSIREGGIDALMYLYKQNLNNMGGYLTQEYKVNLKRVSYFLQEIGKIEEFLFTDKEQRDEKSRQRDLQNKLSQQQQSDFKKLDEDIDEQNDDAPKTHLDKFKKEIKEQIKADGVVPPELQQTDPKLKDLSYKERWYKEKFNIQTQDSLEFISKIRKSYTEGLCWNYAYYYKGCISWNWYYPYHYAPFASDLTDLHKIKINFDFGEPFKPFYQLLSVFPSGSRKAIPQCYHELMTNLDSEIIDFYPTDFFVDLKGKRYAWLGEVILPFIDEQRLIHAAKKYDHLLSDRENFRNRLGNIIVFFQQTDKLSNYYDKDAPQKTVKFSETGIAGTIKYNKKKFHINGKISIPFPNLKLNEIESNQIETVVFENPEYQLHICELKEGVVPPQQEIDEQYLGKTDRKTYGGQRILGMIKRLLGVARNNMYDNSLSYQNVMQHQNQFGQLEQHNNQFVLRQQQTGNVNFRVVSGNDNIQRNRYQRIQDFNNPQQNNNAGNYKNQQQNQQRQNYQANNQNPTYRMNNLNNFHQNRSYDPNQQYQFNNRSNSQYSNNQPYFSNKGQQVYQHNNQQYNSYQHNHQQNNHQQQQNQANNQQQQNNYKIKNQNKQHQQ